MIHVHAKIKWSIFLCEHRTDTPPSRLCFASTQVSRWRHVLSTRTLIAPSPSPILQTKLGNQPLIMVLRPKPSKPSISTWPPRDLFNVGTCWTSYPALMVSSCLRTLAPRTVYLTSHRPRRLGPRHRILPSCFLCRSVHHVCHP